MRTSAFIQAGASVLSGLLLLWSFPDYNQGWLAWFAFVPLMTAIAGRSPGSGFGWALITGSIFLVGYFSCNLAVSAYTYLHHALLGVIYGPLFAILGLASCHIARRICLSAALLAAPFIFVGLEYIRANLFFLAMPMGLLPHSQYLYPFTMQIASLTGAYGISFLIMLVNAAITALFLYTLTRLGMVRVDSRMVISTKGAGTVIGLTLVAVAFSSFYAYVRINRPPAGNKARVAVIQPNIPQDRKWDRQFTTSIMQIYQDLTLEAAQGEPVLVVWPESAVPGSINIDRRLYQKVRQIAKKAGTHLLIGSTASPKINKSEKAHFEYRNSAFLIPPDPKASDIRYDKTRLLPFAEYLPLEGLIPWSWIGIPEVDGYIPGKKNTVLELPGMQFSVTICWENIFPQVARKFVQNGAKLIVNITNEAWFERSAGAHHFLSISVLRAVENNVFVVRSANTGVSCFIDPNGRIIERVQDARGSDLFVTGVITQNITLPDTKTLYTVYGDMLVWICFIVAATMTIIAATIPRTTWRFSPIATLRLNLSDWLIKRNQGTRSTPQD